MLLHQRFFDLFTAEENCRYVVKSASDVCFVYKSFNSRLVRGLFGLVGARNDFSYARRGYVVGKSVRAEQYSLIAVDSEIIALNVLVNTQSAKNYIFVGVIFGFLVSDFALIDQILNKRVILRNLLDYSL